MRKPEQDISDGIFRYDDLHSLVVPKLPELIEVLNDSLEEGDRDTAFIDVALEMEHPQTSDYANALSLVIAGESFGEQARLAGYRSFHFAHTVGSLVLPVPTGQKTADFYSDVDDIDAMREKLELSTAEYLGHRWALDTLTSHFTPELDPSGQYPHLVEVVAGSTFMFIDEAEKARAIDEHVADFQSSLENFPGL